MLKCCHCGHEGTDVEEFNQHVGGQGIVRMPECVNLPSCSLRQEDNMIKEGDRGGVNKGVLPRPEVPVGYTTDF